MKGFVHRVSVVLGCVALCAGVVSAQVPGDGIPDVYYFFEDGATAQTSLGELSLPGGTLTVDTDGSDMVAVLVSGPDGTGACNLCDATSPDPSNDMPGSMLDLSDFSSWTLGFIDGSTQWIRGNPLEGTGFRGIVSTQWLAVDDSVNAWPEDIGAFVNFPTENLGLTNYGPGLDESAFPAIFDDGSGEALFAVKGTSDSAGEWFANVTVVRIPEPAAGSLLGIAGLALLGLRRRN